MYCKLSSSVRVYVTEPEMGFLYKYEARFPIRQTQLDTADVTTAQTLAAKTILVRKKLDNDTLYNLNRTIRFEEHDDTEKTGAGKTD